MNKKHQIWTFLAETNSQLNSLSLSINTDQILLSTIYLSLESRDNSDVVKIFEQLFGAAPQLKNQLNQLLSK